ncbi:MAG: AraC family transcriptional regulator [Epsilonproteobacteria bacterium]|nr:AraC family transcriptional regulator [Campylobacterota bacterium]
MCNTLDLPSFNLFHQTPSYNTSLALEPYAQGSIRPLVLEEGLMLCHFDLKPKENLCLYNAFEEPLLMFATFTQGGIEYEHHDFKLQQTFKPHYLYPVLLNRENGKSYYEKERLSCSFNLMLSPSFLSNMVEEERHPLSHLLEKLEQKPFFEILSELPMSQKMLTQIKMLSHLNAKDPLNLFLLKSNVYELLHEWLSPLCKHDKKPYAIPEIECFYTHKVADYIHENLLAPLSLEELCRIAKTNATKLQRNFKHLFHQSLFNYISAHRLEHAKNLLEQGEMDINDVAKTIGYAHQSNFTSAFAKYFGYTPKSVLKQKTFYM